MRLALNSPAFSRPFPGHILGQLASLGCMLRNRAVERAESAAETTSVLAMPKAPQDIPSYPWFHPPRTPSCPPNGLACLSPEVQTSGERRTYGYLEVWSSRPSSTSSSSTSHTTHEPQHHSTTFKCCTFSFLPLRSPTFLLSPCIRTVHDVRDLEH